MKNSPRRIEYLRRYYQENKERTKERVKIWRKNNPEKRKGQDKKYYQKHRNKIMENTKKWQRNNPKKVKDLRKKYYLRRCEETKEKRRITRMARHYLRTEMFHRDGYKCKDCGSRKTLEMHELKYEKPYRLENVITLCKKCHGKRHRRVV